ncbi:MAG: NAD(+) synthase [Planctomycetales bacterium 4484_123]|nr:MAG: NAD(+) synthase [Planctomycetales bacterium 4484_123]
MEVPIEPMHRAFEAAFAGHLPADRPPITDENIQARIRGSLVMAFSNALGHLPLATGATGYCTLYGDMVGGLAVIGDVPKTMVYRLARHLNAAAAGPLIPQSILTKPPSAELKPGQIDQDELPPYEQLDEVLHRYVERAQSVEEMVRAGLDEALVRRVVNMITAAEYKRRQAPPTLKVTARAFGSGRRVPIACKHELD